MTFATDINITSQIFAWLGCFGLLTCGIFLLVQAQRAREPAIVVNGRVVAKGLQRMAPIVVTQPPPRLAPGAELGRLADIIKTARRQVDTITACQRSAARHLDSAEVALNRLLSEIVSVMPPTPTAKVESRPQAMAMGLAA